MKMVRCGRIFAMVLSLFLLTHTQKAYSEIEDINYLDLDTGYRWDKISNRVVLSGIGFGARVSTQMANKLGSYQLGLKGQYSYCQMLVKGSFHYGWIKGGRYDEGGFGGKAGGHTMDALGGFGYLFCISDCWGVAPLVGWSYDEIDVKGQSVKTPLDGVLLDIGDIKYKSRFQGPWLGADVFFEPTACSRISLGYEFHIAHWNGTRTLEQGELGTEFGTTTGFSNIRKLNPVLGNVFSLDGAYTFCGCWDFGIGLKYQIWKSVGSGRYKRTIIPTDPAITSQIVEDVEWNSFSLMFQIGYMF